MKMTPDARASLDATVQRIMRRHHLPAPLQSGIQYELMSHLHAAGEKRAAAEGRDEVTSRDLNEAVIEMGGESALAEAFVAPLAIPLQPAPLGRRVAAAFVDFIVIAIAATALAVLIGVALAPLFLLFNEPMYWSRVDWWDPDFDFLPWRHFDSPLWVLRGSLIALGTILLSLAYFGYFEGTQGRTLGKKVFDLRVVRTDGEPMDVKTALIRNAVKAHPSAVWLLAIDSAIMWFFFRETGQRASDRIAETRVVDDRA